MQSENRSVLHGNVALITGASAGIGAATAEALAAAGCHVVLAARRADRLETVAERLARSYPVQALAVPTDITDAGQRAALMATVDARFGRLDILINNAGLGLYGPVAQVDLDLLRELFEINVTAAVATMQAALPLMRRQGNGVIVNVSSILGKVALPQLGISGASGGYAASKFALHALSSAARMELAPEGIHVVTVCPGRTDTEFDAHFRMPGSEGERPPARRSLMPATSPQKVARRIVRAIQRREREVFISWTDRLLVWAALLQPGLYEWAMTRAARLADTKGGAARDAHRGRGRVAISAMLVGAVVLLWLRAGRSRRG